MKPNALCMPAILLVILFLVPGPPARSQSCGPPPDEIEVTLLDGSVMVGEAYMGHSTTSEIYTITITGDGFSITIDYSLDPSETLSFEIKNSEDPYAWSPDILNLGCDIYPDIEGTYLNADLLQPDYRVLWDTLQDTCDELITNAEFWAVLNDLEDETVEIIRSGMEEVRDGQVTMSIWNHVMSTQFNTCGWGYEENGTSRGYSLQGPTAISINTSSEWGSENPELHLSMSTNEPNDRWNLKIDPVTETCEVWIDNAEAVVHFDREDWEPQVERFLLGLEFYLDILPLFEEYNVLETSDDMRILIEKSIEGINSYPIELVYPDEWSEAIM